MIIFGRGSPMFSFLLGILSVTVKLETSMNCLSISNCT